jgi:hypothetical protein
MSFVVWRKGNKSVLNSEAAAVKNADHYAKLGFKQVRDLEALAFLFSKGLLDDEGIKKLEAEGFIAKAGDEKEEVEEVEVTVPVIGIPPIEVIEDVKAVKPKKKEVKKETPKVDK